MKKLLLFSILIFFTCLTATQAQVLFDAHSGDGRECYRLPFDISTCESTTEYPCPPKCLLVARCDYERKLIGHIPKDSAWYQIFLPASLIQTFTKKGMTTTFVYGDVSILDGVYRIKVKIYYASNIEEEKWAYAEEFGYIYLSPDLYLREIKMI